MRSGEVRGHLAVSDDPVVFTRPDGSTGEASVSVFGTVALAAYLDSLPGIRSEDIGVHIVDTVAGRRSRSPTDLKYLVTLGLKREILLKYPGASLLASPPPPPPPRPHHCSPQTPGRTELSLTGRSGGPAGRLSSGPGNSSSLLSSLRQVSPVWSCQQWLHLSTKFWSVDPKLVLTAPGTVILKELFTTWRKNRKLFF